MPELEPSNDSPNAPRNLLINPAFEIHQSGNWTCFKCKTVFSKKRSVGRHLYSCFNLKSYKLETGNSANTEFRSALSRHRCTVCFKSFKHTETLKTHLGKVHKQKVYKCHVCSSTFTQKAYLKFHMYLHLGLEPFACKTCSFKCSNPSNLRCHEQKHETLHARTVLKAHKTAKQQRGLNAKLSKKLTRKPIIKSGSSKIRNKVNVSLHKSLIERSQGQLSDAAGKKYACTFCSKTFKRKDHLKIHTRTHTGEKPYVCSHCNFSFSQSTGLKLHLRRHHASAAHQSIQKNQKTVVAVKSKLPESETTLNKPKLGAFLDQNKERRHQCTICKAAFKSTTTLRYHAVVHTNLKPYSCKICDAKFTHPSSLFRHRNTLHGDMLQLPGAVDKMEPKYSVIEQAKPIPTGIRPISKHTCGICSKVLTRKQHLQAHMRRHTGEKPFQCHGCGFQFRHRSSLVHHRRKSCPNLPKIANHSSEMPKINVAKQSQSSRVHMNQKIKLRKLTINLTRLNLNQPKVTELQAKKAKLLANAKRILRKCPAKEGKLPKTPCPFCQKLILKSSLTRHMSVHTGEKPFKCTQCDADFNQKSSLEYHQFKHTNARPYECTICKTAFSNPFSLKQHIPRHKVKENSRLVRCVKCFAIYSTSFGLLLHMKVHREAKKNA